MDECIVMVADESSIEEAHRVETRIAKDMAHVVSLEKEAVRRMIHYQISSLLSL